MKRIKSIIAACGLLAVTAVVFAGKPAFNTGLYAKVGTTAVEISSSYSTNLVTSPTGTGQQAAITNQSGVKRQLYADDGFAQALYMDPSW